MKIVHKRKANLLSWILVIIFLMGLGLLFSCTDPQYYKYDNKVVKDLETGKMLILRSDAPGTYRVYELSDSIKIKE